jgi:p21-activated kinase 2
MEMCKHPAIVHYEESYNYKNCLFMFIEFMDGGALTDLIYQYPRAIPEHLIAYISREIFMGLAELHHNCQIHRDLKSDNVLVKRDGSVKIADFGFATQLTKEKAWRKSQVGTPAWMAPELISKREYNEKVDIWSAGMIVYELAETEPPFLRFPPTTSMYLICQRDAPRLPSSYSPAFRNFIELCMDKDPTLRRSADELLRHEFLRIKDPLAAKAELGKMIASKAK